MLADMVVLAAREIWDLGSLKYILTHDILKDNHHILFTVSPHLKPIVESRGGDPLHATTYLITVLGDDSRRHETLL